MNKGLRSYTQKVRNVEKTNGRRPFAAREVGTWLYRLLEACLINSSSSLKNGKIENVDRKSNHTKKAQLQTHSM